MTWLNDAHAMEKSIVSVLGNHVDDEKNPVVQQRLWRHLDETRRHADMVEELIKHLGGDVSSAKSTMSSWMGRLQGMSTAMSDDELVKDDLSDYSTEACEIGSHRALISAVEEFNTPQVVTTCERIIQEEESMAEFLNENLARLVKVTPANEAAA